MLSPERHRHHRHPPPPQPPPPPHHPPQPSHVVATIENLPAEGGSGGGRSGISAPSSSVRQRIRKVLNSVKQENKEKIMWLGVLRFHASTLAPTHFRDT
ncbi:hypothetical protein WISP_132078 [Willisornis vidua]|uniref:Uncharacterized protein n=1 Tax=Willisornis vidua TaxID=1566151 RepID=A0ABQ9CPE3_9PASS|nr:hypothetical protein WISP_132078 [Willisornis vidua]